VHLSISGRHARRKIQIKSGNIAPESECKLHYEQQNFLEIAAKAEAPVEGTGVALLDSVIQGECILDPIPYDVADIVEPVTEEALNDA